MKSELIAAWITAIATAVTAFAIFLVERSRRRYERQEGHLQHIKKVVVDHLNSLLISHYFPVLDRKQGILKVRVDPIYLEGSPSTEVPIGWKPVLSVKTHELPVAGAAEHQKTYPYLYADVKRNHFPQLVNKWELFTNQFEELGHKSLEMGLRLAKELQEIIGLPPSSGLPNQQGAWVNYLRLSVFLYERVWGIPAGVLNIGEESGKWILRWFSDAFGQGTKEEMENCRRVVDSILASEKISIQSASLKKQALDLKPEAISLREELEQLSLKNKLPGRCDYLKS